jgi:isopentenyl diphosphate isomerase/L-lactate dehydrogenase-like FMN-dependent dehydrogenase
MESILDILHNTKEKSPTDSYKENMMKIANLRERIVPNIYEAINISEIERLAISKISLNSLSYFISGANDEFTLKRNIDYFKKIQIIPRVFVDVSKVNTQTKVLGNTINSPIMIAPSALHKILHPDGELATAKAAQEANTIITLSTLSSTTLEDVGKANDNGIRWFQLYVMKEREQTVDLIRRAEKANYTAIVLTVDAPILGYRDRDLQVKFKYPEGIQYENLMITLSNTAKKDVSGNVNQLLEQAGNRSELFKFFAQNIDPTLNWDILKWLRSITKLPIILKGIHSPEDAILADKNGIDAIIVSNHGARQLDTAPSTIEMLYPICRALKGSKMEIYVDGGFRRGTDIFKALAMGAKGIMLGRPVLWGLACDGKEGVKRVLDMLNNELLVAMKLAGCSSIDQINDKFIKVKDWLAKF